MERDIKILETFINNHKFYNIKHSDGLELAIENLINRNKELEEENATYKKANEIANSITDKDIENAIKEAESEFIPKSVIKEKIEELKKQDKEWTEELSEPDSNFKIIDRNLKRIKNQIEILQELLEKEE